VGTDDKSIFQKIGDAVADYAPGIATALSLVLPGVSIIPAGAIGAVGALARAFGLGSDAKPEDILKAVSADPEIRLKAMVADNDFKLKQRDQDIEELKAHLADIQSARARQIEHEKATGKSDINIYVLAWTIVIGFFALMGFLLYVPVPQDQSGVIFMLFGTLATGFGSVLQYFFGSSKGSDSKTNLLAKAQPIR
jgi:hypothetical protein